MAKKVMSLWKPPPQFKFSEKEKKKKSKFYIASPDMEVDDVFISKSPIKQLSSPIDNNSEFEDTREKFFKKYNIPDEGKKEFARLFMNRHPVDKPPRQAKSKRPVHSTSSVGLNSSPRYKETRMSLPSLSTNRAPSPTGFKISRKISEGAIATFRTPVKFDESRQADTDTLNSVFKSFGTCVTSYDDSVQHTDVTPVDDDKCIFHHRCRSTSLDQPLNQFQISIGGSSTIVIADSNTIILHGQNAELVSHHQKIALKLLFNMKEDIIARLVNANFLEELSEIMLQKGAAPLEIGKGCIEVWLSFAKAESLKEFMNDLNNGKLRDELARLLLRHEYIKDDEELTISIKDRKVDKKGDAINKRGIADKTEVFNKDEGVLEPINFMMTAYKCTDLEQLDTILSCKYEERVPLGGFTQHFPSSDSCTGSDRCTDVSKPSLNTFPTLLHFAAFHGLDKLCECLADTPGFSQAAALKNKDGLIPVEMAADNKQNIKNMLNC